MSVEIKTAAYLVHKVDANLATADHHAAFVLKDDGMEAWCVCHKVMVGPWYKVQDGYTAIDPRDFVKSLWRGDFHFHMVELRTDLTPPQKTEMKSILDGCVSGESWPVNALTEMESRGLLNEEAVENRKNSTSMTYH